MANITTIEKGQMDWHKPVNANFAALRDELATPARYNLAASDETKLTATDPYGVTTELSAANLDTGSFMLGNDYFVFVSVDSGNPVYRISRNKAFATGNLVGGFHFGKVRRTNAQLAPVNTSGAARGSGWEANVYDGIVPRSVWTLAHRPKCSPEGMAYLGGGTWVDIYLSSDDKSGGLASAMNKLPATGTEGFNWYDFNERAMVVGKRLLTYSEWLQMAVGSPGGNNGDNVNAWTATTNTARKETGFVDRAVSSIGCRDAVGNVWEWCDDFITRAEHHMASTGSFGASDGARGGKTVPSGGNGHYVAAAPSGASGVGRWNWDAVSPFPDGYGNIYEYYDYSLVALLAGGNWSYGVQAGARTVSTADYPWDVSTNVGARCACDCL